MKMLQALTAYCLLALTQAGAEVRYVSQTGSDESPYTSWETAARRIQTAVDVGEQGDIIVVGPGHYSEQVDLKEGMVLWGSGPTKTVLEQPQDALYVVAGGALVEVRDLTIVGHAPQEIGFDWTKGIFLEGGNGQLVSGCEIRGLGFGIYAENLLVGVPCVLRDITVSGCARGISLRGWRAHCAVVDCSISEGGATLESMEDALVMRTTFEGRGLALYYSPDVRVIACELRCPGRYEAIFTSGASVTLANCLIAGPQYGVDMSEQTLLTVHNSTITQCGAPFHVAEEGEVRISSSIIWGNSLHLSDSAIKWNISEVVTSDIEGGFEAPDPLASNIDLDPLFQDPDNGDFHLRSDSPCIDYWEWDGSLYDFDLDGKPRRLYGGRVANPSPNRDLGAYEYRINDLTTGPGPDQATLTWSSLSHKTYSKTYSIFYTDDLLTWHLAEDSILSAGNTTTSWTDDGSKTGGIPPLLAPRRFYRILENP